jgi:protein phosphatase 1 regulatory subunit 7
LKRISRTIYKHNFTTSIMPSSEKESTPPHISIEKMDEEGHGSPKPNGTPRNSTGWDGKLRIEKEKRAELVNPEAISDPEYSDEEQVLPGETIAADEGNVRNGGVINSC